MTGPFATSPELRTFSTPHGVQGAVGVLTTRNPDRPNDAHTISCSGTLVSPKHFVTAAHCVNGVTTSWLNVSFPQEPGEYFRVEKKHSWTPYIQVRWDDVALLTLVDEVPTEIVANYPKFNTGSVSGVIHNTRGGDFLVAGFGYHYSIYGFRNLDGKRRFGKPIGVRVGYKMHGVSGSGNVTYPPLILSDRDTDPNDPWFSEGANFLGGDSGGPIFAKERESDEYILLGVTSGSSDHYGYNYSALLGASYVILTPELGPDGDGDGVPDIFDNCPPSFCEEKGLDMERCYNPLQRDDDGDGIGDSCDNCPPSLCKMIPGTRDCANAEQIDSDGDGIGDVCDVCPLIAAPGDADPFMKNVGDECGCSGMNLTYLPCTKHSTICESNNAGTCLYDYDINGNPLPGLCSKLPDADEDGIPDACDSCGSMWDPVGRNSNVHIERELGRSILGDVCEGVPLFPFEASLIPYDWGMVPSPGSGALGVDVQKMRGYPWLGESHLDKSFAQPVVFRHCSCLDSFGNETSIEICAEYDCPPSQAEFTDDGWVEATTSPNHSGPSYPSTGVQTLFDAYEATGTPTSKEDPYPPWRDWDTFYWQSYQDIIRTNKPVKSRADGSTYGLMASVVRKQGGYVGSQRDSVWDLRTSLTAMRTPLSITMPFDFDQFIMEHKFECLIMDCFTFINFPFKEELPLPPYPVDPMVVLFREGLVGMMLQDGGFVDAKDFIDPRLIELTAMDELVILPPAEPTAALKEAGINLVGVALQRDDSLGSKPNLIYDVNGVITLGEEPQFESSIKDAAGKFRLRDGQSGVFSAKQGLIYTAGLDPVLRVYDVHNDLYRTVGLDRNPSERVEGFTLDTFNNRLYSLEIHEVDGKEEASIFEYNVGTGTSRQLMSVPWTGAYERLALIADTADTLILMGSKGVLTESWRFLRSDNKLEQVGKRTDEGVLFNEPHHASRTAVMLLGDNAFILELNHSGFFDGPNLEEL